MEIVTFTGERAIYRYRARTGSFTRNIFFGGREHRGMPLKTDLCCP